MRLAFRYVLLAALGAGLLGSMSCSSDDNGDGSNRSVPDTPEGRAVARVVAVFGPLVQQAYLGAYASFLPSSAPSPIPRQCTSLPNACLSGSAEFCPSENGGTVAFTTCDVGGTVTDGTIAIAGGMGTGSATIDLEFGEFSVSGTLLYAYIPSSGCLDESFTNLFATSNTGSVAASGQFRYCNLDPGEGVIVPTFGAVFGQVSSSQGSWAFNLDFPDDGEYGDFRVSIHAPDFSEDLLYCSGNVFTMELDCFAP
jgi:hypothetical protein